MARFEKGNTLARTHGFKPGQSGNPGGKPKAIIEVALAARQHTVEAVETLVKIMRDSKATASARVSAAAILIERGWGKAPVTITLNRDNNLRDLTDDELLAIAGSGSAKPNGSGDPAEPQDDPPKPN
jgi:Family of unknown function (DUF5681)